jgi:hypothetical protein
VRKWRGASGQAHCSDTSTAEWARIPTPAILSWIPARIDEASLNRPIRRHLLGPICGQGCGPWRIAILIVGRDNGGREEASA